MTTETQSDLDQLEAQSIFILREAYARRAELHAATYRVPHHDVAGTAANTALHLAAGRA